MPATPRRARFPNEDFDLFSCFFAKHRGCREERAIPRRGLGEVHSPDINGACEVTLVTQTAAVASDTSVFAFPVVRRPTLANLWRLVRETDIVHIAGPSLVPLLLAFLARKPVVVEHHGYQAICPNGLLTYQPGRAICPGHFQQRRYWKCWRCQSCEVSPQRSLLCLQRMFPRSWLVRRVARNLAITRPCAIATTERFYALPLRTAAARCDGLLCRR